MAKQTELRALIDAFKSAVSADARWAHLDGPGRNDSVNVAENRIFSFFDQMRKTIDGLAADVERRVQVNRALTAERDEAVRQVTGLLQQCAAFEDQLRKGDTAAVEDMFVPLDLARKDGLEVLIGAPGVGKWLPATYIVGHTPLGFHVVEAAGHGIVVVTDATVGLRHRIKAKPMKTVTMYANILHAATKNGYIGSLYETEDYARRVAADHVAHAAVPVKVTVAE